MKKIDQSRKAKKNFYSPLIQYLRVNNAISKIDIADYLGVSERMTRKEISEVSVHYPVISNSKNKGYRLTKNFKNLTKEEAMLEIEEVQHTINELQSRVTYLKAKMKPLIAYKKACEKYHEI